MYRGRSRPSKLFIREQLLAEIVYILCAVHGVVLTAPGQLRLLDLRNKLGKTLYSGGFVVGPEAGQ